MQRSPGVQICVRLLQARNRDAEDNPQDGKGNVPMLRFRSRTWADHPMTVRQKTLAIVALAGVAFMATVYGAARLFILSAAAGAERAIRSHGSYAEYYFVGCMLVAGIFFFAVIVVLLERAVFSRLCELERGAAVVSPDDVSAHVNCKGGD
jgi:hypothetical protein